MNLSQAISAAGMTPPANIIPGRWVRFPGVGKGRSNRSGWCRVISPTLAIFGDWSSGVTGTWRDDAHRDDETSTRLLAEARARERQFAADQKRRHEEGARRAQELLDAAKPSTHPYLIKKGFPHLQGLVFGEHLLVPVRDVQGLKVISLQQISADGEKRFLHGARVRNGIYRLGAGTGAAFLCEGYATGLSVYEAAKRIHRSPRVFVCFSAGNIEVVAHLVPKGIVCADHDISGVGERIARKTGLPWVMPPDPGDFNDLHVQNGLHSVVEILRERER